MPQENAQSSSIEIQYITRFNSKKWNFLIFLKYSRLFLHAYVISLHKFSNVK